MPAALGGSSHSCPESSQGVAIAAGLVEGSPKQEGFAGCSLGAAGSVAGKAAIQILPGSAFCSGHCAGIKSASILLTLQSLAVPDDLQHLQELQDEALLDALHCHSAQTHQVGNWYLNAQAQQDVGMSSQRIQSHIRHAVLADFAAMLCLWMIMNPLINVHGIFTEQICMQAVVRGCRARRRLHEEHVLVPLLAVCLNRKNALVASRYSHCLIIVQVYHTF